MVNKDLHKALCRGYLSLAASRGIPIWRHEPMSVYVVEFPAGIITFPIDLIGELAVADYQGDVDKPTMESILQRLEDPLRFPLPLKEKDAA